MTKRSEDKRRARVTQHVVESATAYACGRCDKVYRALEEAQECCTCDACGSKFDTRSKNSVSGHVTTCGHCQYPAIVRYAREAVERERGRVRSVESELAVAEKRLADCLAVPRPAKGAAQVDW